MRAVWLQVTRDVPMYTMVSGDRAELRGLNLEGLRRSGFSTDEVRPPGGSRRTGGGVALCLCLAGTDRKLG